MTDQDIRQALGDQLQLEANIVAAYRKALPDILSALDDEAVVQFARTTIRAACTAANFDRCDDHKTMSRLVRVGSPFVMVNGVERIDREDWPRDPEAHAA